MPSGYTPAGGGSVSTRFPAPDATPPIPGKEEPTPELESLKGAMETLRSRLEAQEVAYKSFENSNALMATNLEQLRKPPSKETVRQRKPSNRRLVANDDTGDNPTPPSQLSLPFGSLQTKSLRIRALERQVKSLKAEAKAPLNKARKEGASSDDGGPSTESSSSSSSSLSVESVIHLEHLRPIVTLARRTLAPRARLTTRGHAVGTCIIDATKPVR